MMKQFKVFKKLCSLALILSMLVSMIPINVFATTTKSPVIDGTKTGSLTITKYDQNTEGGKKPISDIKFNIYKVLDIGANADSNSLTYKINSNFEEFFNGVYDTSISYDIDAIKELNGSELEKLSEKLKQYIEVKQITPVEGSDDVKTATTNNKGIATFSSLKLGYYFVVEEKSNKVESVINPFFVSIPMTTSVTDEQGNIVETYWEYDVAAEPKNITNTNNLNLVKTGKIGNNDATPLSGVKFNLEKQNTDGTWTKVSEYVTENGKFSVTDYLDRGNYRLKEVSAPEGYILDTYEFEIRYNEETKELEYFYNGETFTKNDGLTIQALNEKPTVEKTVEAPDFNIGDTVEWEINATVPSTIENLKTFELIDTLSEGLDFANTLNLVVKQEKTTLEVGNHYKVTQDGRKLTITFNPSKLAPSKDIVVTYDTILNKNAVIGEPGNPNHVELNYSSSTETDSKPITTKPEVDPKVYTFGLKVLKVDNAQNPLEGAVFNLYQSDGKTLIEENLTTDKDGIISFPGLDAGAYVLVETKAPKDYNLLKEPVKFTITADYDENGNLILEKTNTTNGYYELTVVNNRGFQLPETGGMGTVIFTVAGLGMMGLAGAAYIALKRKESQK